MARGLLVGRDLLKPRIERIAIRLRRAGVGDPVTLARRGVRRVGPERRSWRGQQHDGSRLLAQRDHLANVFLEEVRGVGIRWTTSNAGTRGCRHRRGRAGTCLELRFCAAVNLLAYIT